MPKEISLFLTIKCLPTKSFSEVAHLLKLGGLTVMCIVSFGMFKRSGSAYEELCMNKVLEAELSYFVRDLRVTDNIT